MLALIKTLVFAIHCAAFAFTQSFHCETKCMGQTGSSSHHAIKHRPAHRFLDNVFFNTQNGPRCCFCKKLSTCSAAAVMASCMGQGGPFPHQFGPKGHMGRMSIGSKMETMSWSEI